jgi:hypothetical protein
MVTEAPLGGQWVYRSNASRWCPELIYTDPLAVGRTAEHAAQLGGAPAWRGREPPNIA